MRGQSIVEYLLGLSVLLLGLLAALTRPEFIRAWQSLYVGAVLRVARDHLP